MTDWADIQVGDIVFGKDGQAWVVAERDGIQYTVERDGRPPYVGNFTGPVRVVETAAQVMGRAVDVAVEALDGVVLDVEHDGVFLCPPDFDHPGVLMAHLYRLHGVRFDAEAEGGALRALADQHKRLHDVRLHDDPGYVYHHHDPHFEQANR